MTVLPQFMNLPRDVPLKVTMRTTSDCRLGFSYLPWFTYDASAGVGLGTATWEAGNRLAVEFDPDTLVVPSLDSTTTSIYGAPLLPGMTVAITPRRLAGWLNPATGEMWLHYDAEFLFSAPLWTPPPLIVRTLLTTGEALPVGDQLGEVGSPVSSTLPGGTSTLGGSTSTSTLSSQPLSSVPPGTSDGVGVPPGTPLGATAGLADPAAAPHSSVLNNTFDPNFGYSEGPAGDAEAAVDMGLTAAASAVGAAAQVGLGAMDALGSLGQAAAVATGAMGSEAAEVVGARTSGGELLGRRMDLEGKATLVGTAMVQPTGHGPTDALLKLPAEATAVLTAYFTLH
ncbi:hypothetical protein N2152v2_008558 [Parachlorella kessleri]